MKALTCVSVALWTLRAPAQGSRAACFTAMTHWDFFPLTLVSLDWRPPCLCLVADPEKGPMGTRTISRPEGAERCTRMGVFSLDFYRRLNSVDSSLTIIE